MPGVGSVCPLDLFMSLSIPLACSCRYNVTVTLALTVNGTVTAILHATGTMFLLRSSLMSQLLSLLIHSGLVCPLDLPDVTVIVTINSFRVKVGCYDTIIINDTVTVSDTASVAGDLTANVSLTVAVSVIPLPVFA